MGGNGKIMHSTGAVKLIGRFLDQPMLVSKLSNQVPKVLVASAALVGARSVLSAPKDEIKNSIIKNLSVLTFTVASSLIAVRGLKLNGKTIISGLINTPHISEIANGIKYGVQNLLKTYLLDQNTLKLLKKAQSKILVPSELNILQNRLAKMKAGKDVLELIMPHSKNLKAAEIFGEIKKLSLLGLIPLLGGITGGIFGEKLVGENWKAKLPNKVKEGFYQFFANIFLCNIGAGTALYLLEKANIHSKAARAAGMAGGILSIGVIGGSFISNFLAKNIFNPIVNEGPFKYSKKLFSGQLNDGRGVTFKNLNSERHPEIIDIMLHSDDFATVGVLSGFKFIESLLPVIYSISGYRAGIGYRNGEGHHHSHHHTNKNHNHGYKIHKSPHNRNFYKLNHAQKTEQAYPFAKFERLGTSNITGRKKSYFA